MPGPGISNGKSSGFRVSGMYPLLPRPHGLARLRAVTALSAVLLLGLCGCQTDGLSDITGSLGDKIEKTSSAEPARGVDFYRDRFRANPEDADAALQYAKALRAAGQKAQ